MGKNLQPFPLNKGLVCYFFLRFVYQQVPSAEDHAPDLEGFSFSCWVWKIKRAITPMPITCLNLNTITTLNSALKYTPPQTTFILCDTYILCIYLCNTYAYSITQYQGNTQGCMCVGGYRWDLFVQILFFFLLYLYTYIAPLRQCAWISLYMKINNSIHLVLQPLSTEKSAEYQRISIIMKMSHVSKISWKLKAPFWKKK